MARTIEAAILRVAAPTAGVCTRAELLAAGVASSSIAARVAAGSLVRLAEGLFEVPELGTGETRVGGPGLGGRVGGPARAGWQRSQALGVGQATTARQPQPWVA